MKIMGLLLIVSFVFVFYALGIALVVWLVISLKRIRSDHETFRNKLEAIERLLLNKN